MNPDLRVSPAAAKCDVRQRALPAHSRRMTGNRSCSAFPDLPPTNREQGCTALMRLSSAPMAVLLHGRTWR
jgi:hypothetical protein